MLRLEPFNPVPVQTSDEAVSDLSSLSDEASPDQAPTFEDLLAQAVVTKVRLRLYPCLAETISTCTYVFLETEQILTNAFKSFYRQRNSAVVRWGR